MKQKLQKRMGALLLTMIMLLLPLSNVMAAETPEVGRLSPLELMEQPDALITRGEFIMLVNSVFMLQADGYEGENFLDVPDSHPYAEDILCARAIGYIRGDGKGYAFPDSVISGAEAAVIINKLLGFDTSKVGQVNELPIPVWAVPSASVLLDLTMAGEDLIIKKQLSVSDAVTFINALAVAVMYQSSPYGLTQADPQDDFFAYANRQFLATATVPTGYMYATSFVDTAVMVGNQEQDILSGILSANDLAAGSDEWKINELFKMYMDNETRTASISKIQPYFDEIRTVETIDELLGLAKKYAKYFDLQPFYGLSVDADAKVDATKWCVFVMPASLDLGSKEYYAEDESLAGIQQAYKSYVGALLEYIGETDDIEGRVNEIYSIEAERASKTLPAEAYSDPNVLYTETTWEEMLKVTDTTNTLTYMNDIYEIVKDMSIYCPSIEYTAYIESLYTEENLQVLKDFAMLNVLSSVSSMLGDDLSELSNDLMTAMYGETGEAATLEQRAQSFVTSMMSTAFSRMYAEAYGSEEIKSDVTEIVESIRDKYRERIQSLAWMSDETKAMAIEKLNAIQAYVAYPDEPLNAVAYEVVAKDEGGSLVDLYFEISDVSYSEAINMFQEPVDHDFWTSVPTSTVNAFYSPTANAIIIPLGILQGSFYSPDATREENLGAIGAIIAHEFTHAFDTSGAQFDKNGTLVNWWTEEDYAFFSVMAYSVIEALSDINFVSDIYVNGALCVGETIADLGAMACVLDIADDISDADLAKVMESWASIWAARMSPELVVYFLYMDSHAPNKVRVNFILPQMEHFYNIYDVAEGDGMYLPEDERLKIW